MSETLSRMFLHILKTYPKNNTLQSKKDGRYAPISTEEFGNRVKYLSLGLKDLGVSTGDKLVILAENGPDWIITDYANLCLGGVTVPIYTSLMPEPIKYIINDSDARVVVCAGVPLWQKLEIIKNELPQVKHFISLEEQGPDWALNAARISERGKELHMKNPGLFERAALAVRPDDLASIIYTSGTTGIPKGVMLSHLNFTSNVKSMDAVVDFNVTDQVLTFLPLSHVLEHMTTFAFLFKGCSIAYAETIETVAENLVEVRPTIMVSVPRLFEKIYTKVTDAVLAGSPLKRKIFSWALNTGKACSRKKLLHQPVAGGLRFKQKLAHKLVFSKILEKTGGHVKFFVSGGAPLSKDIAEFFHALGIVILEGYGLTETAPVVACNTFDRLKFGTVGPPVPGVEIKIAADGEILVKGPNVMKGYYKKEAETREVFDGEGWFHTGDIGRLDDEGFLVITDRKKDIIITAGGKNVAPQPIENKLKQNPFISNAVVVGSRRKFISALIVPNFDKLTSHARDNGIPFHGTGDLVRNPKIVEFLMSEVDRATPQLASFEKIKRIALLERDFEIDQNEMTPTLKVKRSFVEEKHKALIDSLYND